MNQKGLAPILIVILIALVIGGYFIYNNTSKKAATSQSTENYISKTSPDGMYTISEEMLGDYNTIKITDKGGKVVTGDLVKENQKEIGYGVKYQCMCSTHFQEWIDNTHFKIKVVNGGGEEYEFLVNAVTGKVDESSFKKVSGEEITKWLTYEHSNFIFKYPVEWYAVEHPDYPGGNNISFFLIGTKADHGYGDHKGNEVFSLEFSEDKRSLDELKNNYYPGSTSLTIAEKPAIKTSFGLIIVKPTTDTKLNLVTGIEEAKPYVSQILPSFKFTD